MRRHTRLHMNGPKERKPEELSGEGEYLVFVLMILTHSHMHCGQGSDIPASTKSRHPGGHVLWSSVLAVIWDPLAWRTDHVYSISSVFYKVVRWAESPAFPLKTSYWDASPGFIQCILSWLSDYLYFLPSVEPSFPCFDYSTSGMIIKLIWLGIQRIIVIMTLSIILFVVHTPCLD